MNPATQLTNAKKISGKDICQGESCGLCSLYLGFSSQPENHEVHSEHVESSQACNIVIHAPQIQLLANIAVNISSFEKKPANG